MSEIRYRLLNLTLAGMLAFSLVINCDSVACADTVKAATMPETQATFRKLAGQFKTFDIHSVLYDRFQKYGKEPFSTPDGAAYKELLEDRHSKVSLLSLLKDNDPKVRTLAIAALYSKEDPSILPAIVALAGDKAKTYPEPVPIAVAQVYPIEKMPTKEKTVGEAANDVVRFYMEAAGYYYGIDGVSNHPGFSQYWLEHKDRKYSASWFVIKLRRASTGCSPTDKTRTAQIKEVRRQIDAIAEPDRNWILLYLQSENGFDVLASEADLVQAMKRLGPQALLKMLQCKIETADPDLKPQKSNNMRYKDMQLAALKHAGVVLLPKQADALLACDKWEREYQTFHRSDPLISPWWGIAAAALSPHQASRLLHAQYSRLDEDFYGFQKAELSAALLNLCGSGEIPFLVDCFYDPSSFYQNKQYSQYRPQFLRAIVEDKQAKKLLAALVKDTRFKTLDDASALSAMNETFTKVDGRQPISYDSIGSTWHPLGLDRACSNLEDAKRQYPKETSDMLANLASWRQALSKRID